MSLSSAIVENYIAPLWASHEKSDYIKISRELKKAESLSLEERRETQWELLKLIVHSAFEHCPYYRKKYQAVGFHPGDLKTWEDFEAVPVLTKKEIRENAMELIAQNADRSDFVPRKTSGSTGVSLNFFSSDSEFQFKRGVTLYRDQWSGWRLGEWQAMVWGNPEYKKSWRGYLRNYLLERGLYLDTLKMDEAMMKDFARRILKKRPTLLFGHAHSLYLFAKFWENENLPQISFKGIISTAMVLHSHEREKCEQVFGSRLFDRYGCEEVSLIASECEAHQGLHTNSDSLVVEVVGSTKQATTENEGAVIVTDLRNMVMPFIRYQVGDMAVAEEKACSCGRTYPLLKSISGRIADYLISPEGQWISGISLTENFATLIPGLEQVQIVQEKKDFLRLRIVSAPDFNDKSMAEINRLVLERFGASMKYEIEKIEKVEPTASGKYRFAINKIQE